jgi:hypothetical protein
MMLSMMKLIQKPSQLLTIFLGTIREGDIPLSRRTFTKKCVGEINKETPCRCPHIA